MKTSTQAFDTALSLYLGSFLFHFTRRNYVALACNEQDIQALSKRTEKEKRNKLFKRLRASVLVTYVYDYFCIAFLSVTSFSSSLKATYVPGYFARLQAISTRT